MQNGKNGLNVLLISDLSHTWYYLQDFIHQCLNRMLHSDFKF